MFDLMSWFLTWGQIKGGIYLSPWNHDRWLTLQGTNKVEYVFIFGEQIKGLSRNQSKLNFFNQLHPKFAFLRCLFTQTAT